MVKLEIAVRLVGLREASVEPGVSLFGYIQRSFGGEFLPAACPDRSWWETVIGQCEFSVCKWVQRFLVDTGIEAISLQGAMQSV